MIELLYTSVSPEGLSEEGLLEIQLEAQRNNASKNITGMLVYYDREIMQLIEGEQEAIESLYEKIRNDPRHMLVEIFYSGQIKERAFKDWSMEVVMLDEQHLKEYLYNGKALVNELPIQKVIKKNPNQGKKMFLSLRDSLY
ncbi:MULTISPECIES: BLUF domain-containing protein [unclassified Marinomonas]|uniref:BLUF domain-containing protein n=1 Tax=unclassified Marinomonas TaxID=196814 RepID=UPI0007AFD5FE|nr:MULTISPECIES: BLUF domain-containing protein [unclassified Marinomonas]